MPTLLDSTASLATPCNVDDLLDSVLSAAPGTIVQLDLGANLLFAGCGRGEALAEIARLFPRSRLLGVERATTDLVAAQRALGDAGIQNTQLGRPDIVRRAYLQGIFNYIIRLGGEASAPMNSLPGLMRDGSLLFDIGEHLPSASEYHDAGLIIIRTLRLPNGCRAVIAGNWGLPSPRT